MIGIVDYGMGNLGSVAKGLQRVGAEVRLITEPREIPRVDKLVLPGVGAFADAIGTLRERELVGPLLDFIASGKPFLGICLGLQLLFDTSYEDGEHTGLGVIRGKVVRFQFDRGAGGEKLKVPHMGWNQVFWDRPIPILAGLEQGTYVYFVHSYYVAPDDPGVTQAWSDYGGRFTCLVWRDNVFASQFHPEKSQRAGLRILENFHRL